MKSARKKMSVWMPSEVADRVAAVAEELSRQKLRRVSVASLVIDAVVKTYCRRGNDEGRSGR